MRPEPIAQGGEREDIQRPAEKDEDDAPDAERGF